MERSQGMDGMTRCCATLHVMKQPTLIVFDLDGTIADSRQLARVCYQQVFAMMGCGHISEKQADSFNGPDADEICRVMGIGPERRALYDQLVDETTMALLDTLGRMFPGTAQMLADLAPHAHLAILTNGTHSYCQACMDAFGIGAFISLHSGFVSGVSKAQRIGLWQRELGASRVIVVGDRCTDIENARKAGAYAIGVTYGMGSREELAGADSLCDTPDDVRRTCMAVMAGM